MKLSIRKYFSEILTIIKDLDNTPYDRLHLQLFRPSVIRGPWVKRHDISLVAY